MTQKIAAIFLSLAVIFSLLSESEGFLTNANRVNPDDPNDISQREYTRDNSIKPAGQGGYYGGHDTLTAEGMLLKQQVHQNDADGGRKFNTFSNEALRNLRTGAHDEDQTKIKTQIGDIPGPGYEAPIGPNADGNYFQHYYNPDDGGGYSLTDSNSAVRRAMDYNKEIRMKIGCTPGGVGNLSTADKQKIYDYFGRSLHLLQDMAHPNHTNDSLHVDIPFENYLNDHWDEIVNSKEFQERVTVDQYKQGNYNTYAYPVITNLMHDLAQISKKYPTEEQIYDSVLNPDGTTFSKVLNQERLMRNANDLVPEAIKYSAAYINAIYNYINNPAAYNPECDRPADLVNPAGDHPDDRFDVSDEFYWEKEFKLTEAALTELYLRTAVKKGKIGVWYKKRFMEVFIEGRTKYKDASREEKDSIEANFQGMKKRLEKRGSQMQNDWKGAPDIALFTNGFYNPSISLILKIGEPVSFQDIDFNPEIVKDHPVLLVPTGGFYGLKNSEAVKKTVEEYVKNGGTLVLFTQQHGYDWGLLPTPLNPETGEKKPVSGYGYQEDQSCQFSSVYIDTYHPILSNFPYSTADVGVDGYFTSYPEDSTILLRRTANGQPAMILYPYGKGYVIATTLYADFALSHHQTNQAEINLVQNIISWAKRPAQLPEIKPGETVSISVNVTNYTDVDAASVKFTILDPSRKVISEQTQGGSIQAGQSAPISFSYTSTPSSALGIYHIDYTFLDGQGNVIQPQTETDSGRFVVSKPASNPYKSPDFYFSIQSDSEQFLYGSSAIFTFNLWNNTDTERQIKVVWEIPHHHETWQKIVNVPRKGHASFTHTLENIQTLDRLRATIYDESQKQVGYADKGIWMFYPSVNITAESDKTLYTKGSTVAINAAFKNNTSARWQSDVRIIITDPQNTQVFEDQKALALTAYGTVSTATGFTLPTNYVMGSYTVRVEAWYGSMLVASASTKFEVLQSQISVAPTLPSVLNAGTNIISFTLVNRGKINVSFGTLEISLKEPDGVMVYSGSQPFSMGAGESTTFNVPLNISSLKFGTYTLTYAQSDETKQARASTVFVPNESTMALSFDKPYYRVREAANLTVDLMNTGKFNLENAAVSVSVPEAGYGDTKIISLSPNYSSQITFSISIPDTIPAGQRKVDVTVAFSSGASFTKSTTFTVPEAALVIGYIGASALKVGDMINLTIENTGGVDAIYSTEKLSIVDIKGVSIHQGQTTGAILAGEKKNLIDIQIPAQTVSGTVFLILQVTDNRTGKMVYLFKPLEIIGLKATLQTRTGKEAYLKTEAIGGLSNLGNGSLEIKGGILKMAVGRMDPEVKGKFLHFLPLKGWGSFSSPSHIATGADGSIYVVDAGNHRMQKFDSGGNFITKWGGEGSEEGEFRGPEGIAVAPDGSVYVADRWNQRIQKFDSSGNFLASWKSEDGEVGYLLEPNNLAVGSEGSIYVIIGSRKIGSESYSNFYIQKLDSNGNVLTNWGRRGSGEGEFIGPKGITVAPDGSVYVADTGNNRIQKFFSNGTFILKWGGQGNGNGEFEWPAGVAVGPDGFVYVVERDNRRIQKFDSGGNFIMKWGSESSGEGEFNEPEGIAVAPDGSVYAADTGNDRILRFDGNGNLISKLGSRGSGDGEFEWPQDITVGPDGSVYVMDEGNNCIQKFDRAGNFIAKWTSFKGENGEDGFPSHIASGLDGSVYAVVFYGNVYHLHKFDGDGKFIHDFGRMDGQGVHDMAVGPDGSVYLADYNYHLWGSFRERIQKFDKSGNLVLRWGSAGSGDGEFDRPEGIAVGPDGSVYLADTNNNRIQKFDGSGNFITKWGIEGSEDGQFLLPSGIAVGSDGSVYVSENGSARIQRFDRDGIFFTKWGIEGSGDGEFYGTGGIALGLDDTLYVADSWNHRIQRMIPETLFEAILPINQPAYSTQDYTIPVGTLNTTGKLYLQATLTNKLGQTITQASYPFYIFEGNTVLSLDTDKKVYKPGETVVITGQVENRAAISADGLVLSLTSKLGTQSSQLISTETFSIPTGGTQPFRFFTTAGAEGTVALTGKVSQNESTHAEVTELYEVAKPRVSVSVTTPDVVGNEPFSVDVQIKNIGKRETTVSLQSSVDGQVQEIALTPGEAKLLQYSQQITRDTTYAFTLTGDFEQTVNRTVLYGLAASITINPQAIFPEGNVSVPVTITNTGQLAGTMNFSYQLTPGTGQQSKVYYLPPWASITDTLDFNLTEGDYQISASSEPPQISAQASFSVRKENRVEMGVSAGVQAAGLSPVLINLTNQGCNDIGGSVSVSISEQDRVLWSSQQAVAQLPTQSSHLFTFNVNPAAMLPGVYALKVDFLSPGGQPLTLSTSSFAVSGPVFQITQLPPFQTFYPGQEASFNFRVKNTGDQEGAVEFCLKTYDLIDLTRREWLKAGEEKILPFSFILPADLEEKDYFADYELKGGAKGQVKYHLSGININVRASLDKASYREGEVARLTLSVSSPSPQSSAMNLFARVNYPGYESKQPFSLTGSQLMPFDIPLTRITGEKLFFGIYHESGRSVHLNSLYIHKAGDVLIVTTDKQVYKPSETVSVSVSGNISGNMTLSGPRGYADVFPFSGSATRSFILPSPMTAGTYYVSYQLSATSGQSYTESHPFDVAGIQVKVKEAKTDKAKYATSDTIHLSLTVESNQDIAATLKTWVVDPEKGYTTTGTQGLALGASMPLVVTQSFPFTTTKMGIHRLIYGIYSGDLLLCSGSEAFDMGTAAVLGVSSEQPDYPTGKEAVVAVASLFGTGPAALDFFLDDQPAGSQMVTLSGFSSVPVTLPAVSPGRHLLKARLTSGELASTKETSFIYGSGLPDLAVRISSDPSIKDGSMQLTITVTNQGKSDSSPTTLRVYDGPAGTGSLLATLDVQGLVAGASQTLTYSLGVLGRAGGNSLSAVIDPLESVYEFNEGNNGGKVAFTVPDLTLATALDKEVYSPGDSVVITGLITNLSKNPSAEVILTTEIKDGSGLQVFTKSQNISPINGLATLPVAVSWQTGFNLPEGTYTVIQAIPGKGAVTRKTMTLKRDKDFAIGSDQINKKAEVGEAVQYNLTLTPLRGFAGEVSLSIKDCPAGFTVLFTPNVVSLAGGTGQATLKMIPTAQVKSESYALKVNASGGGRSHDLDLLLGLTDFQLAVTPGTQNIKQLDGATYIIALTPLNGFDSPVTLEVEGVPRGMRASLEASQVTVPDGGSLTISTSKWLLPKAYGLTIKAKGRAVSHEAVAALVVEKNPVITPGVITAPGFGESKKPLIRTFRTDGVMRSEFQAFDFSPGLHIAAGDVDGDGIDEVIVGVDSKSHKSPALMGIFKRDGTAVATMEQEQEGKRIRVTVAAGDVDGDWVEEVAVASYPYSPEEEDDEDKDSSEEQKGSKNPHPGGQGLVRIYKVIGGKFIDTGLAFFPYEGEGYRGAANIAFGDVDGDGELELITAPGPDPQAPARIKVFKIDIREGMGRWKIAGQVLDLLVSFEAEKGKDGEKKVGNGWPENAGGYGANVAAGDLDGDGKDEILVGARPDPKNNGRVIMLYKREDGYAAESFTAYEGSRFGVCLSSEDVDGDGVAEILTGPGPDPKSKAIVKIFRWDGTMVGEFQAYLDSVGFGVMISKGTVGE